MPEKEKQLTLDEAKKEALDKVPNTACPKTYYSISPKTSHRSLAPKNKGRGQCLLWGYHKQSKYIEVVGYRHKSLPEFQDSDDARSLGTSDFLATGRVFEGRGSVLFNKKDILSQRIVAEELWSRYPTVRWWVFEEYNKGPINTLVNCIGAD